MGTILGKNRRLGSFGKRLKNAAKTSASLRRRRRISGVTVRMKDHTFSVSHAAILTGFHADAILSVAPKLGLAPDDLANRCGISRATFRRNLKRSDILLSPQASDALARYTQLQDKAVATFDGDLDAAQQWLLSRQPGLGNALPLDLAQTTPGFREVEKLLTRIDHGVYA